MGNSIRFRLWSAATISILVALAIAGVGLRYLFELNVERRIVGELTADLNELIGATSFAANGQLSVAPGLTDPRFTNPLSVITGRWKTWPAMAWCARVRCGTQRLRCPAKARAVN